jgi:hypothetical protein
MRSLPLTLAASLCLATASAPAFAAQAYDNCTGTISSLPTTISTQGTWCLKGDLATAVASGAAITINANNVAIDCNGFKLGGLLAGPSTQAIGIFSDERLNATVRRCAIRGFAYGVKLGGAGHLVEDSRFDSNTVAGIQTIGGDMVIRRNRVNNTGNPLAGEVVAGITTMGASDIIDNSVVRVVSNFEALNIGIEQNGYGTVSGNHVQLLDDLPYAIGIRSLSYGPVTIQGNDVVGPENGQGIYCDGSGPVLSRNIVVGYMAPITGCTDVGDNDDG